MTARRIEDVWKAEPTREGAGVHLDRAFGFHEVPRLDPYLLLDSFHSKRREDYEKGFPWHPHRGIETITYVIDGEVEHGDSLGNGGVIKSGDVQWMTAASGIVHQEMPRGNKKGELWGTQLWANMPAKKKMTDPRYQGFTADQIPTVEKEGVTVRVISGEALGARGPVQDEVIEPLYIDVSVPAGKTFTHPVKLGHTVFAFVVDGEGYFDQGRDPFERENKGSSYDTKPSCVCGTGSLVRYGPGDQVTVVADKSSVRFLLVSGKPLGEPVAWYGPIVMNTREELRQAFDEYASGKFLKHGK